MARVCLVLTESLRVDYENIFRRASERIGIQATIHTIPFMSIGDTGFGRLRAIRQAINYNKQRHDRVIFCPGTAELFVTDADHLFVFSAYRGWMHKGPISVLPHAWPTIPLPDPNEIKWTDKPPLTVGFMGTGYTQSRFGKIISKLPQNFRCALLRGDYLKYPHLLVMFNELNLPLKNLNTFARAETIAALNKSRHKAEIDIVVRPGFSGGNQEKQAFIDHLIKSTYVVCPRGIENFSFRVYEALRYGRVPVIVDTDMALPHEVDWDRVAIRVPYKKLDDIVDVIRNDYASSLRSDFIDRQMYALDTIRYLDSDDWLDRLLTRTLI